MKTIENAQVNNDQANEKSIQFALSLDTLKPKIIPFVTSESAETIIIAKNDLPTSLIEKWQKLYGDTVESISFTNEIIETNNFKYFSAVPALATFLQVTFNSGLPVESFAKGHLTSRHGKTEPIGKLQIVDVTQRNKEIEELNKRNIATFTELQTVIATFYNQLVTDVIDANIIREVLAYCQNNKLAPALTGLAQGRFVVANDVIIDHEHIQIDESIPAIDYVKFYAVV